MNDGFAWWLVILGVAVGVAVVWLVTARLPRAEDDVDEHELVREADWISRTINAYGGVAPQPLVEEVLELHRQYLSGSVAEPPAGLPEMSGIHGPPPIDYGEQAGALTEVRPERAAGGEPASGRIKTESPPREARPLDAGTPSPS
jgi:hypothetical protein